MPLTDGKTCLAFLSCLDTKDKTRRKTKTRHYTKDCLCLLSLRSSLLAIIKPFLKLPSFEFQKPLDISPGRHYYDNRGERWRLSELNEKATESITISWKASERVRK